MCRGKPIEAVRQMLADTEFQTALPGGITPLLTMSLCGRSQRHSIVAGT
jgi:hypothetical protein